MDFPSREKASDHTGPSKPVIVRCNSPVLVLHSSTRPYRLPARLLPRATAIMLPSRETAVTTCSSDLDVNPRDWAATVIANRTKQQKIRKNIRTPCNQQCPGLDFSVQPRCSLCLCGCCIFHSYNHRDTENTEVAQRRSLRFTAPHT